MDDRRATCSRKRKDTQVRVGELNPRSFNQQKTPAKYLEAFFYGFNW
jgi:hypothetical protein